MSLLSSILALFSLMMLPMRVFPVGWNKHPLKQLLKALTFTGPPVSVWNCVRQCTFPLYNNCTEQLGHHLLMLYHLTVFAAEPVWHKVSAHFSLQILASAVVVLSMASHSAVIFLSQVVWNYRAVFVNTSVRVHWELVQLRKLWSLLLSCLNVLLNSNIFH